MQWLRIKDAFSMILIYLRIQPEAFTDDRATGIGDWGSKSVLSHVPVHRANYAEISFEELIIMHLFHTFLGDDGNLAKLEHCNFTGNTGFGGQLDFGAGVALSYLTVFRQRVISPRHEIKDWWFAACMWSIQHWRSHWLYACLCVINSFSAPSYFVCIVWLVNDSVVARA